ncbi:DUF6892 domain-containing protein [Actinoallomurus iriomotensis]|uniref:DUF6892 domain-containing protein n=1 Tax=Actinoallomurus iriomotensis TaxID=478107 RepID=A0A9W6S4I6_9ACTN|nr:hypothetical protein [Actinoallomurus iriomotensis]GLY86939.1 hypothetical protein Airi02_048680 [Actinoallomurus iriomotensis]
MIANALAALEDRNLRLAVLDTLMATKVLPPFDIDEFNRTHAGDEDDDRDYRYRDEVAGALLDIPVTAEQCASVRELVWEAGGNEVVYAIWTFWDGETDEFRIESLEGIDTVLPDLESLSIGDGAVNDLTPLAGCTALRRLSLRGGGAVTDVGPLSGLGSLRKLELEYQNVRDLRPLAGLALEHLSLDGEPDADLSPLESLTSLRTLCCRRMCYTAGSEAPIVRRFDNARVIEVLERRGVDVEVR